MIAIRTTHAPIWIKDLLLVLSFALLFVAIVALIGAFFVLTSEPEPLRFPLNSADGVVPLTRLYCTIPK
jgi:hypothetical protein